MDAKIKLLTITFVSFFSCILIGCGNSSTKQESETTTQQENLLVTVFKETLAKKESFFELIRKDVVKERIINDYSQNFYDKLCQQIQVSSPISYTDGKYEGNGTGGRYGSGEAYLSYTPANDIFTINFTIGGETIQRDGEVYYNTEGWDVNVYEEKNDFNEVVNREPISRYFIKGKEYTYSKYKLVLVMRLNYITLWTNEDNMMTGVKDIRVKDHDSGTIYNIAFDQPFFHKNGGAMNADIGVVIFDKNEADFINLISSLNNYTISIRSESGELLTLTNPENFNNIRDVYLKLVQMWEDMKK